VKLIRSLLILTALTSLVACSAEASGEENAIHVRIQHSRFDPARLQVEPGSTVTFIVTNEDPIDHELIIGNQEVQDAHEEGTEAHHGARPGEISIPAGEERTTVYTFEGAGELIYGCHLPGHYDYGMRGVLEIR
jgi:uncharacterized cupredoxin-like copper-binding protein